MPTLLILDEPTQGVDVGAKAEIHALMRGSGRQGLAVLMISSELPEILGMSDRIAVMHDGTMAGVLTRADATAPGVLAWPSGQRCAEPRERSRESPRDRHPAVAAVLAARRAAVSSRSAT